MFGNYYQVRDWLEGFIPQVWGKQELGLERIIYLLKLLGNPQNQFKSILIAGTSGKGSVAFYIARLLQSSQFKVYSSQKIKVGLHVSPHLIDIRERMQINGKLIELTEFIKLIEQIRTVVEEIQKEKPDLTPSYFEILVAAAFLYFAKVQVDWAVVEVGLGGRLDATNVLKPEVCVITNVGLDHTEILGKNVEKITFEKAGIIKEGIPIITGATGKALKVIEKVAKGKNAPLIKINTQSLEKALKFDIFKDINIPIDIFRSPRQNLVSSNALLAIATVKVAGFTPTAELITSAFSVGFSGRFEEVDQDVILDGAHNLGKVRALLEFARKFKVQSSKFKVKGIILVVAFKKGKNWRKMIDLLVKNLPIKKIIATKFYATTDTGKFSTVEPVEIRNYIDTKYKILNTKYFNNSQEAVFAAIQATSNQQPATSLVLVTGSLYLVGEVRMMWHLPEF